VLRAGEYGFEIAFDEVTERLTVKDPTSDHKAGSNHHIGLAADLLLYKNGEYLQQSDEYKPLGEIWEAMGPPLGVELTWGGRFSKPDGNHFSLKWLGHA
jgi:hypothetical protein